MAKLARRNHSGDASLSKQPSVLVLLEIAASFIGLLITAALIRWSLWWPHDDNRQNLASFAAVLSGGFGIVLLAFSWRGVRRERRFVLAVLVAGAVLIGATAGFAILIHATKAAL
jgi:hypothetical protein